MKRMTREEKITWLLADREKWAHRLFGYLAGSPDFGAGSVVDIALANKISLAAGWVAQSNGTLARLWSGLEPECVETCCFCKQGMDYVDLMTFSALMVDAGTACGECYTELFKEHCESSPKPVCFGRNTPWGQCGECSWMATCAEIAGWKCRVCGCSHYHPCPGGCWWVKPNLCSACEGKSGKIVFRKYESLPSLPGSLLDEE